MEDNFVLEKEFNILKNNNWLDDKEIELYLKNEDIIEAIDKTTSPKKENIFNSLKLVPRKELRVVILGQDPYPNPNHAHGLAFSSKDSTTPDSLKNIFKAIDLAYNTNLFENKFNDLTSWAQQGVLMLNTGLTYEKLDLDKIPKSEQNKLQQKIQQKHLKTWRPFINNIIKKILEINTRPLVMLLWGNSAHELVFKNIKNKDFKNALHSRAPQIIPNTNILLLQTSHPSPLSVNRGGDFLDTAPSHFIECEKHLGINKINWNLR